MTDFVCSNNLQKLLEPTIIQKIVTMSKQHNALNLASGFPDWETPDFVVKGLLDAIKNEENQYCLPGGHPELCQQVSKIYSKKLGFDIEPNKNISVGQGASGCIYDIYTSFLNQGDEVVIFDPHYEFLSKEAILLGAVVRHYALVQPKDNEKDPFSINFQDFEKLFNDKTKIFLLNNPQNPTGKLFTYEELLRICEILRKYPKVIVIADEVYENLVFDNKKLIRFATMPGMQQRTISVYSMGKLFSCTGWRIGLAIGPENLIKYVIAAHSYISYSVNRPAQVAIANALAFAENPYNGYSNYYEYTAAQFEKKRNKIVSSIKNMKNLGLKMFMPEGGYFIIGSFESFVPKIPKKYFYNKEVENGDCPINKRYEEIENPDVEPDVAFCMYLIKEKKVSVIPLTSFYGQKKGNIGQGRYYFRIALCRKDTTFDKAFQLLQQENK